MTHQTRTDRINKKKNRHAINGKLNSTLFKYLNKCKYKTNQFEPPWGWVLTEVLYQVTLLRIASSRQTRHPTTKRLGKKKLTCYATYVAYQYTVSVISEGNKCG